MNRASKIGCLFGAALSIVLPACATTVVDHSGSGGSSTSGSTSSPEGGEVLAPCGGLAGIGCHQGLYCAFDQGGCGAGDSEGACMPAPPGCDNHLEPICACDGKFYENPCKAMQAGADPSSAPSCMFKCGDQTCNRGTDACQQYWSADEVERSCTPLPKACWGEPTCTCAQAHGGWEWSECHVTKTGHVIVWIDEGGG